MEQLNPTERWAAIPGYEGYAEASDLGRIRSIDRVVVYKNGHKARYRGQLLKPHLSEDGRLRVVLSLGGDAQSFNVHRLVLLAFAGPCPDGMEGCHNNGNSVDNRLVNLRWDTHRENIRDQLRHGTNSRQVRKRCPRGHLLAEPNITAAARARGTRICWACSKAADYGRYCKQYGRPFDFKSEADAYYERIMAGDTGNRHKTCRLGHLLEPPNIPQALAVKGQIGCLACRRAGNARADAKRAGRAFDFQKVADLHYERILAGVSGPLAGASLLGA